MNATIESNRETKEGGWVAINIVHRPDLDARVERLASCLGNVFAYALARVRNLPLLFKGDDFSGTDIERAMR